MNYHPDNVCGRPLSAELTSAARMFLSHRSADKQAVRELAEYLEHLQVFYYFDERDETLRRLREQGHSEPQAIVNAIDEGIAHSTHLLAILSRRTIGSWWVASEIGVSRAKCVSTAFLFLPSITPEMIPEHVQTARYFWSPEELFKWCQPLGRWPEAVLQQIYSEWSQDLLSVEMGLDEEEIGLRHKRTHQENARLLQQLEARLIQFDADPSPVPITETVAVR